MNQKQEQALFGSVLPKDISCPGDAIKLEICTGVTATYQLDHSSLLTLARTQREAIGALIELHIWQGSLTAEICDDTVYLGTERTILSVVLQDTWEQVREAWEN